MKKCLKCECTYSGHGGLHCSLDGETVEYNTKCCAERIFDEQKKLFKRAGWILSKTPLKAKLVKK